jgi:hypothetical protein
MTWKYLPMFVSTPWLGSTVELIKSNTQHHTQGGDFAGTELREDTNQL